MHRSQYTILQPFSQQCGCRPLLYNHTELETLLQKQLGSDTEAWETVRPCIMPTYDCDTNTPFIWETGIPIPGDDHVEEYGYKHARLWEVCRATSAAPTYLKPAQVRVLQFTLRLDSIAQQMKLWQLLLRGCLEQQCQQKLFSFCQ